MRIVQKKLDVNASRVLDFRELEFRLLPDEQRVILLSFTSGDKMQMQMVFEYMENMGDGDVAEEFAQVQTRYAGRHPDFEERLLENYEKAKSISGLNVRNHTGKLLTGAYFTMEYAFQASALFNPSIVPHPDQTGLASGSLRFIMSLRAVGEGHVSSVVFHTGILDDEGGVTFDAPSALTAPAQISPDQVYVRAVFSRSLTQLGFTDATVDECLLGLEAEFTPLQLETVVAQTRSDNSANSPLRSCLETMLWLGRSNYKLNLAPESTINQLFLFPKSDNESRGIEDLRLVRFVNDDGSMLYYGTYTAYNGSRTMPVLVETRDFHSLSIHTLNGSCVKNKGMALFPRRINGHYAMCSRIDGRNLFLMYSDHLHFWESAELLASPKYPWEFRLIGNCGSPIETSEGWLLITHGVGAMRQYAIGAMLLDLDDPIKIRGRLREPMIVSTDDEREGYVPNVVYSCGSLIWNKTLILPYAISDRKTAVAEFEVDSLLAKLILHGP